MIPLGEVCSSPLFLGDFLSLRRNFWASFNRVVFAFFVSVISIIVFRWSRFYITGNFKLFLFYLLLLGFVSSIILLVIRGSIFSLFIGWEGLGVTSFVLIIFYQNWASFKGGLLTILTNRLGDAILLGRVCYWLSSSSFRHYLRSRRQVIFLIRVISFTKRAQWPFIRWLPAAIAAPTPVSALVHRSTLVTAGIWLVLRVRQLIVLNFNSWFFLGLITLLVASAAALLEKDTKKVVALSTLSQLGLIFISFSLGNLSMCLFHVLSHALAKSNLFLVVGTMLHNRFAQQDSRALRRISRSTILLSALISTSRLVGILFLSGFFSKDQILLGHYVIISSLFRFIVLVVISRATLAYCFKLVKTVCDLNSFCPLWSAKHRKNIILPLFFLRRITVILGFFIFLNFSKLTSSLSRSCRGTIWMLLLLGGLVYKLRESSNKTGLLLFEGFLLQLKAIDLIKAVFL